MRAPGRRLADRAFGGANVPTKRLPLYELTVELDVEAAGDDDDGDDAATADSGIYLEVETGGVRFLRGDDPLRLAEVPPRCFSEVMRDVDLFVAGAAVGAPRRRVGRRSEIGRTRTV